MAENPEISVSVSHRGYFTHHDQKYMIIPLKSTDEEDHAVLTNNQENLDSTNYTCGKKEVGSEGLLRTARSLKSPEVSVALLHCHSVQLSLQYNFSQKKKEYYSELFYLLV